MNTSGLPMRRQLTLGALPASISERTVKRCDRRADELGHQSWVWRSRAARVAVRMQPMVRIAHTDREMSDSPRNRQYRCPIFRINLGSQFWGPEESYAMVPPKGDINP